MFYEIEEPYTIGDYKSGIKIHFTYVQATSNQIIDEGNQAV